MSDRTLTRRQHGLSFTTIHDDARFVRRTRELASVSTSNSVAEPVAILAPRRAAPFAANAPMQTLHSEITSIPAPPLTAVRIPVTPHRVLLWRLHGATNVLACAAVETSYGYAFCLELGGEPILLELQESLEALTAKANRLEASLLARGWEIDSA